MNTLAITWAFAGWAAIALALFALIGPRWAVWIALIGGYVVLPPGNYGAEGDALIFPFWIIGGALPSDVWLSKAWAAPAIAILGSVVFDRTRWATFRWRPEDWAMTAFCLWPLLQGFLLTDLRPNAVLSCAWLAVVWGVPYILGRQYCADDGGVDRLAKVLAVAMLAVLPLAILEGVSSFRLHSVLLGDHPFAFDGNERYLAQRPQMMFEHGTLYGLWCASAAVAAGWLASTRVGRSRISWLAATALLVTMTLFAQSLAAILLMIVGGVLAIVPNALRVVRWGLLPGGAMIIGIAAIHLSGIVPMRDLAENTELGRQISGSLRTIGRGSFAWRIGQDLEALAVLRDTLWFGSGRWDWFAAINSRPWGLPLLILGMYGMVALTAIGIAIGAAYFTLVRLGSMREPNATAHSGRLGAAIVTMAAADAFLNSFVFLPAIVLFGAAGGLVDKASKP
ncbi:MAG: hypothetical protein WA908_04055 [Pontixanthobacter sp.]